MKTVLVVIFALCVLTAAMVPRNRRAVDPDDPALAPPPSPSSTNVTICAPQTPCGWSVYRPIVKIIEVNITNNYCSCPIGTVCQLAEEDSSSSFFFQRCQPPEAEEADSS